MTAHPRASPKPWQANYLHLRCLAVQLRRQIELRLSGREGLRLLDVGCGEKPYADMTRPWVAEYVGLEHLPGPHVDVVGFADALPFDDASFDAVLSSQVLEHVEEPDAVIREASRVLRPGGVLFLSTHGVINYHPNPEDYWRWTHAGLARLLRTRGDFETVDVYPNGGTASALAYLGGRQLDVVAGKARVRPALAPAMFGLNVVAWNLDRAYRHALPGRPPDLSSNYLAVAVRPT